MDVLRHEMADLSSRFSVRVCPPSERERRNPAPDFLPELPGVFDASSRADALVAAEDDERLKAVIARAIRVREAVVERMLAGQKRHDARAWHVGAEVDDEVSKIVFFSGSNGAVGKKHERAAACQAADCMIGIDPRIAAGGGLEFRPWRPELRGDNARTRSQLIDKSGHYLSEDVAPRTPLHAHLRGPRIPAPFTWLTRVGRSLSETSGSF